MDEIANKIIAILRYPSLVAEIVEKSRDELRKVRWEYAARKDRRRLPARIEVKGWKNAKCMSCTFMSISHAG